MRRPRTGGGLPEAQRGYLESRQPAPPQNGKGTGRAAAGFPPPVISLLNGGWAIRDVGETFDANPATCTASMTVPPATSPGRGGFGPELALAYDSGEGNSPFGFGWSPSFPSITRETDQALPLYEDASDSDVFILSGAEDLVPQLEAGGPPDPPPGYTIDRCRPRIEGLFARIKRWTREQDGDVHWRSISADNVVTTYGEESDSGIAGPTDPRRVFSWLICETRGGKGNAVVYDYEPEDGAASTSPQRTRGTAVAASTLAAGPTGSPTTGRQRRTEGG